jgi:hypothetical protein
MTTTFDSPYLSERFRELHAQGQAVGEVHAVLTVLDARGVEVPEAVREQILACTDLTVLDTWLRRAVTADSAEDVVREVAKLDMFGCAGGRETTLMELHRRAPSDQTAELVAVHPPVTTTEAPCRVTYQSPAVKPGPVSSPM